MKTMGVLSIFVLAGLAPLEAQDWEDCQHVLGQMAEAAEEAASAAGAVVYAQEEVESKQRDLDDCRNYPEIYDLLEDGCSSQHFDLRSAKDDLESYLYDLESELEDFGGLIGDAESECGITFASAGAASGPRRSRLCRLLLSSQEDIAPEELARLCLKYMSEAECLECLERP